MWQSANVFAACVLGPTLAQNNEIERKKRGPKAFGPRLRLSTRVYLDVSEDNYSDAEAM